MSDYQQENNYYIRLQDSLKEIDEESPTLDDIKRMNV